MSTATASPATTAPDLTVPTLGGKHHFLLRRLHSLTGIVFGGYLIVHLLINATLVQGTADVDVYGVQVGKIHSLPFLGVIEWTFIYIPILYHTVYGIWITLSGQPNVTNYPYGKNIFYLLQRISAIVIVVFILFHVLSLKYHLFGASLGFDHHHATETVQRHMARHWSITWVLYPLGILASCFHLANGFWAAAITWGLTISAGAQRRWGLACAGLFVLTFLAGMTALIAAVALAR